MSPISLFHNKYFVLVIFFLCTFFIYFNAFSVGLLSDDFGYFLGVNKDGWHSIENNFNDPFFLPLSHVFQLLIFKLFGQNLYIFHAVQLFFHVLIGWQLYLIFREINHTKKILFAFLTGLLFLILPYQTETIIWLSSKGYVFCLFFTCLSIRYYLKGMDYLSYLFIITAVFCKEMGYIIPIVLFLIEYQKNQLPLFKKKLIPLAVVVILCISFRMFILNSVIGGYGETTHLNFNLLTITKAIGAYFIKYSTFYRYSNSILTSSLVFVTFIFLSIPILKDLYNKRRLKNLFFIIALFITSLLPIINLEVTSLYSIQSDRYGYFSTVVFAIILSHIICCWKNHKLLIISTLLISTFSTLTFLDTKKWTIGSQICDQYLDELSGQEIDNLNVLLINAPDNYKGVYVLRNGISNFLAMKKINTNVKVLMYQNISSKNWAKEIENDTSFLNFVYLENSKKYDQILFFTNGKFKRLDGLY